MNSEYLRTLEPRRLHAVTELTDLIRSQYPDAAFQIGPGTDEPESTYIAVVVDLDDPDEVMDLIIDRLIDLQVEQNIPISVIPTRTPERVALLERRQRHHASAALLPPAPFG